MVRINLRNFYPWYGEDSFADVPDDTAAALFDAKREESNYIRCVFWNKAHFSLDRGDAIENDALFLSLSPYKIYERKLSKQQLYAAIAALPDKQGKRVYAYYILGMSQDKIAKAEGIGKSSVSESIKRGLRNMEKYFKKMF